MTGGSPSGETLEQRIMRHEGLRLVPYRDTRGNWSIGYGQKISQTLAQDRFKSGITRDRALEMLDASIANAKKQLMRFIPWASDLSKIQQEILIEMVYQLGIAGLQGFHKFLLDARDGDDAAAAEEMLDSDWHEQTPARCEELARLWRTGVTQQPNGVTP